MPARSPDREIRFGQESVGEPAPAAGPRRVLPDFGDSRRGRDSSNRLRATPLRNKLEELEESRLRRVGGRYADSWQLLTAIPRAARAAAGPGHAGRIRLEQSGRGIPGAKLQRHSSARKTNSYLGPRPCRHRQRRAKGTFRSKDEFIPVKSRRRVGLMVPHFPFTASATSPLGRFGTAFRFAIMFFLYASTPGWP